MINTPETLDLAYIPAGMIDVLEDANEISRGAWDGFLSP